MPGQFEVEDSFDIQVALKIIRHISSGIYRDRAGALRELVSNSFDAKATSVSISTNPPRHDSIEISDNGFGMDAELIKKSFTQVGLSMKVINPSLFEGGVSRPTIGRFGIGFLAAAHISDDIWITSYPRGKSKGVRAHLDLKPYFLYQDKIETFDKFEFGTVTLGTIERGPKDVGTRIELSGVRKGRFLPILTRRGLRLMEWPEGRERLPGKAIGALVESIERRDVLHVDRLQGREHVAWQLAMSTPVQYLPDGPIRSGFGDHEARAMLERLRKRNADYEFEVWFDGVALRKPILLPNEKASSRVGGYIDLVGDLPDNVLVRPLDISEKVGRTSVVADGYLFYQPYRVVPADLRGVLPRLGGVGVGHNREDMFLTKLTGESPILRVQISGEVYVREGLDRALDLDRSGFMELDPEYQRLIDSASSDVSAFFLQAKAQRSRRLLIEAAKAVDQQRVAALARVRDLVRSIPGHSGSRVTSVPFRELRESAAKSDYDSSRAYPAGPSPKVVVNQAEKRIEVADSESSPIWVVIVLEVDDLLGKYLADPGPARREFAQRLRRILEERGLSLD